MADNRHSSMALLDSVTPFLLRLGTVVAGLITVAVGFLYVKQDSLLYFPEIGGIPRRPRQNPRRYRSPQEHDLPFESHKIRGSDGVSIHAWLVLQPQPTTTTAPTLVFFHGNAGNIGLRLPNAVQMYHYLKCNILMVEYRGYGDSDSVTPNEAGLKLDAEAALHFVHDHALLDSSQIFLFGRSLGGAVAFHLAQYSEQQQQLQQYANLEVAGVIVENTFLSISLMVDHLMPLVAHVKGLVLRIGWNSQHIAPTLKTPILLARLHVVENGTHNETWMQGGQKYWDRIARFMAQVKALPPQPPGHAAAAAAVGRTSVSSMSDISLGSEFMPAATTLTGTSTTRTTVHMGDASAPALSTAGIPIMPTSLMNMAKEAVCMTTTTSNMSNNKKKE
ncbi:alpha/beta hydrolase [Fragilaria crotonensis]|nr:alpha/beta hydrolase [Fragilaria crotonensis]